MSRRTPVAPRLPLRDDTVIVRGGWMSRSSTLKAIQSSEAKGGERGISVYGVDGLDAAELVRELDRHRLLPHATVRLSTVGDVRRGGFDVVPAGDPPHHKIVGFPASYAEDGSIDRVSGVFQAPVPRAWLEGADHPSPN